MGLTNMLGSMLMVNAFSVAFWNVEHFGKRK